VYVELTIELVMFFRFNYFGERKIETKRKVRDFDEGLQDEF